MADTEKWPLDFEALNKGDVITERTLREIIKPKSDTDYSLGVLKLKGDIERRFLERGIVVTVKVTRGTLEILTDARASEYNESRQQYAITGFIRSHRRLMGVDASKLTAEQVAEHDRRLTNGATYLTALTEAKKTIKGIATTTKADDERPRLF